MAIEFHSLANIVLLWLEVLGPILRKIECLKSMKVYFRRLYIITSIKKSHLPLFAMRVAPTCSLPTHQFKNDNL